MNIVAAPRLARRLTAGTLRSSPYRSIVLMVGVAVLTLLALASVSVPQAIDRQHERTRASTPIVSYDDASGSPSGLLTVDPLATPAERWNGHRIERRYYAGNAGSLEVPGVATLPRAGEYLASRDLERLIRTDPIVRALFASSKPVGTIEDDGLTEPHQLKAVIGVGRESGLLLRRVEGFGSDQPLGSTDDFTVLNATVAGVAGSLVWLPGVAFLVIITRLAAHQHRRRVRALRAIGMSALAVRLAQASEAGLLALPGVAVGVACHSAALARLTRIPGTDFGFFPADARLSVWQQAGIATLVLAAVMLLSACFQHVGHKSVARPPRQRSRRDTASKLGLGALAVGFVYLGALPVTAPWFGRFAILGMWLSCALVAAGLAIAGPRLVRTVARWLAVRARSAGTLVGLRVLAATTTTTTRLASLACIVIVLLLGSLSFASILSGGTYDEWNRVLQQRQRVPVVATDITGSVELTSVQAVEDSPVAQRTSAEVDGSSIPVVLSSCESLEDLTGSALDGCDPGSPQWLDRPGADLEAGALGPHIHLSAPVGVTGSAGLPEEFSGSLLVSPEHVDELRLSGGSQFYFLPRGVDLVRAMAAASSAGPGVQFGIGDLDRENPDFHQYPDQLAWIFVGAVLSLGLAALATVATALGESADREARLRPLVRLGAPRRQRLRAHVVSTFVPVVTLGWTATIVGWFACRGMQAVDDRASVPTSTAVTVLWATVLVAAALAATALPRPPGVSVGASPLRGTTSTSDDRERKEPSPL